MISRYNDCHHLYADDTQIYLSFSKTEPDMSLLLVQQYLQDISDWMIASKLKLNPDKTEFILIGSIIGCKPLGEHLIHCTCAVFSHIACKMIERLYFFTRSSFTWHNCHTLQFKLQLECDRAWYWYTSLSDNHWTDCEKNLFCCLLTRGGNGWTLRWRRWRGRIP